MLPRRAFSQAASSPPGFFGTLGAEAKRYGTDAFGILKAPLSWDAGDWERAGGVLLITGGLLASDRPIYDAAQRNRSSSTDRLSSYVTNFGTTNALGISGGLLAAGLIAKAPGIRDTGRDALEASAIAGLLTNVILKPLAGRERPITSGGTTDFDVYSKNASFPSGHATEAFAVASVISYHADGWVVPTLCYTLASLVGYARVNDRAHFASDVFAGAILGTAVGRFVSRRHERDREEAVTLDLDVVPARGGLAMRLRF